MAMESGQVRTGGGKTRLSRDLVVSSALAYIDAYGAQKLTMRSLGTALGAEAMSLYRHVSGREDLLEAVVADLLRGLEDALDEELAKSWQGYLQTFAHEVRKVAVEHPLAFPLVATRHPAAPWLRPPLRSLSLVEGFLGTLIGHGFNDAQAVHAYRVLSSFLLGHLLLESVVQGAQTSPAEVPLDEGDAQIPQGDANVDLGSVPTVMRLQAALSEDHAREEFEVGLETLIERIEFHMSQ